MGRVRGLTVVGKPEQARSVIVVGGGIAGLYCARALAASSFDVTVLEALPRFGGRIETRGLGFPRGAGRDLFQAEFGPMRFERPVQPLFVKLCQDLNVGFADFTPPTTHETPVTYPLDADEVNEATGEPLDALQLLRLGIFRMFGKKPEIDEETGRVELRLEEAEWLAGLTDANDGFDRLRESARHPSTERPLHELGLWNALREVISNAAIEKIRVQGTFYHLIDLNPNAVEWGIFWLRLFQLGPDEKLSSIPDGVETVVTRLCDELRAANVDMRASHEVLSVSPAVQIGKVSVEVRDNAGKPARLTADHVIFALPKAPLLSLAAPFPQAIREDLTRVVPCLLTKVFAVVRTAKWWNDSPAPNERAWTAPTRELHYFEREDQGEKFTLILFYTDEPAASYWRVFVNGVDHRGAQINVDEHLERELLRLLAEHHVDWARAQLKHESRSGERQITLDGPLHNVLTELVAVFPEVAEVAKKLPVFGELPRRILFTPGLQAWLSSSLGDFAIRDWSFSPFGAGAHAWVPGARSWEVRERLSAFGFAGQDEDMNLHICGEAYSDYQGFIEGALRSAEKTIEAILA